MYFKYTTQVEFCQCKNKVWSVRLACACGYACLAGVYGRVCVFDGDGTSVWTVQLVSSGLWR